MYPVEGQLEIAGEDTHFIRNLVQQPSKRLALESNIRNGRLFHMLDHTYALLLKLPFFGLARLILRVRKPFDP